MKLLIIDNYDSFTFNLYQLAAEVFETLPVVVRNDHDFDDISGQEFDAILISPGPGTPVDEADFGISGRVIREMNLPIFGVCLGHQGICHLMGGSVVHAPLPMHGREDQIHHLATGLFDDVPTPFTAVRYHSLMAAEPLPECLTKTAWTSDGLVMGIAHKHRPMWGVQFHPESICSTFGRRLMQNFHRLAADFHAASLRKSPISALSTQARNNSFDKPAATGAATMRRFVRKRAIQQTADEIFERAFLKTPYAFWLDSSLTRAHDARFSFLGGYYAGQVECVRYYAHNRRLSIQSKGIQELSNDELFPYLDKKLASIQIDGPELPFDFDGGFVGYFGYELKAVCGGQSSHRATHPDCSAILATRFVAIDHVTNELYLVFTGEPESEADALAWFDQIESEIATPVAPERPATDGPETIYFYPAHSEGQYLDKIGHSMRAITDGETYEVCLTNQWTANTSVDAFEYYKKLRVRNPAPYSSFLKFPELSVACSSPERFLKIDREAVVETKPIKGTCRRGANEDEDELLRRSLSADEKSRAENLMIVDLLRNDLGRVCAVGSVHVPKLMQVETYATVHQLVTTVRGTRDEGRSSVDCLEAAFPGGSMTGAPKIRTMEIIDQLEGRPRGIYSGSIGFLSFNGRADLNIVIRTAVFSKNSVSIGVGGAIIALSDPQEEWDETLLKARALLATFEALNKNVVLTSTIAENYGKTIDLSKRVG